MRCESASGTDIRWRDVCSKVFFYLQQLVSLINLLSVAASLGQSGLSSRWLAKVDVAALAHYHRLSVAKDGCDLKAARALNIHKEGIGRLYESLQFVSSGLLFGRWVQKIAGHVECIGF